MLRVAEEGNIKIRSVDLVDWILMADEPDPVPQIRVEDDQADEFEDEPETRSEPVAEDSDADGLDPSPTDADEPAEDERGRSTVVRRGQATPLRRPVAQVPDYGAALKEAVAKLELQQSDDGGGESDRVADLVAMAYTLEERDGADQVMFNALCAEIGEALAAGIEAEDPHITSHWGDNHSRTYIVRLIRNLASNDVFLYRNVSVRDAETNRLRRRRVFGLNREHPLVGVALAQRLGIPSEASEPADTAINDALATPALDEHGSAEAAHAESAADAEAAVLFS